MGDLTTHSSARRAFARELRAALIDDGTIVPRDAGAPSPERPRDMPTLRLDEAGRLAAAHDIAKPHSPDYFQRQREDESPW